MYIRESTTCGECREYANIVAAAIVSFGGRFLARIVCFIYIYIYDAFVFGCSTWYLRFICSLVFYSQCGCWSSLYIWILCVLMGPTPSISVYRHYVNGKSDEWFGVCVCVHMVRNYLHWIAWWHPIKDRVPYPFVVYPSWWRFISVLCVNICLDPLFVRRKATNNVNYDTIHEFFITLYSSINIHLHDIWI